MRKLLVLLSLLISSAAVAESGAYRVEIIIFQNLAVSANGYPTEQLRSFSMFPALLEADLPDELTATTQKSSRMDGVWRRLRSSKGYRPLLFSAWTQSRTDYYPPMRIHDEVVLDEVVLEEQIHPARIYPSTGNMIADLSAEDPIVNGLAEEEPPAPLINYFYRLDGTLQLRRSRFLHIFLDLEYRVKNQQAVPDAEASFFDVKNPALESTPDYKVFSLQQNRQVRSGQFQYFDTPYFGALVLVTAIAAKQ